MAGKGDYLDFVLDCMAEVGPVRGMRFFGGTGLIMEEVQFAYVSGNNRLYFVVDDETRPAYEAAGMGPFWYTRKTSRREVRRWYELPEDVLQDPDELRRWVQDAVRIASGTPAKRKTEALPAKGRSASKKKPVLKPKPVSGRSSS